jgi:hypothetical protein
MSDLVSENVIRSHKSVTILYLTGDANREDGFRMEAYIFC